MGTLMTHVEQLSEVIGPRPATTESEEHASRYIRDAFEARALDVETQSFESPRTYGWAFVLYHLLAIVAAVGSHWAPWPSLVLGLVVAVVLHYDLDTRFGLTSIMPKGPSQNVIGRHIPKSGRGERLTRVVIVAHYDSARSSWAFSPALVKSFAVTFMLMKVCTYVVPLLIAVRLIPFVRTFEPYGWYVTLLPAAYLLVPFVINLQRELFGRFTPGANDNASGVAAMIGVLERLVPEPDAASVVARETAKMRTEEDAWGASVVPDGADLSYSPAPGPAERPQSWSDDDDIGWNTGALTGKHSLDRESARPGRGTEEKTSAIIEPDAEVSARLFGTGEITSRDPASSSRDGLDFDMGESRARRPRRQGEEPGDAPDTDADDLFGPSPTTPAEVSEDPGSRTPGRSRRGERKPERKPRGGREMSDWLGVEEGFDATEAGRGIGSWDNFPDDDDDDFGSKGGTAAIEGLDDPDFAASEAARIRRKVTTNVDRELVEKEVWFVATGCEEVGTVGMKTFLKRYEADLHDALIINIDNIGSGNVCYVTREGMAKRYYSDRRVVSAARRAAREADLSVKPREYRGLSTDATVALARGFRAMSVMAFDINGRLPHWHQTTDTKENVSEANLDLAVDFVSALIKEL